MASADLAGAPPVLEATTRRRRPTRAPQGRRLAEVAGVVGLLFAAVSIYWGLGGMWLLDTVSHSMAEQSRAGDSAVFLAAWVAAVLKMIAVVLPLLALRPMTRVAWVRRARTLAWVQVAVLMTWGVLQTVGSLVLLTGVIDSSTDHRVLAWHAFLWDPWFVVWGLLVAGALRSSRARATTG
jgi:hypothetical protein